MKPTRVKVIVVSGTHPNIVKVAPLLSVMQVHKGLLNPVFLHTGQHYDYTMSESLLRDLGMPQPDVCLSVGSGSHASQTATIMTKFEKALQDLSPRLIIVVGDVNSTLACALTAAKCGIPVAHVEAGLRSFDMTMPEEINRKLTDAISEQLFAPSADAQANLEREGIPLDKIYVVGNIMIDTFLRLKPKAERLAFHRQLGLEPQRYAVVTLHRPSNVDDRDAFVEIMDALFDLSGRLPIVFPIHQEREGA